MGEAMSAVFGAALLDGRLAANSQLSDVDFVADEGCSNDELDTLTGPRAGWTVNLCAG